MSQSFVGEIRMFAGSFAPNGWAFCDGALVSISANETLYSLIGTTYGGDGQSTFALPNLSSRIPIHAGQGPTQTYVLGQNGGAESVVLTANQLPIHNHVFSASNDPSTSLIPTNNVVSTPLNITPYFAGNASVALNSQSLSPIGGSQLHDNMMPFLCVNFIISLFGIYPSQS